MGYKYISEISKEDLDIVSVFPCINDDNRQCIIIKNKNNKKISEDYSTDNLIIKQNMTLLLDDEEYYVHLIESKLPINNDFKVIFNYVFNKISNPIDDEELFILIKSLDEYFKTTPEQDLEKLRIGVFGELLTIQKLYYNGYTDIVKKYHKNFYLKHDVEISDVIRLEIKTTKGEKRIHGFKHNQIYRTDVDVYVSSSLIELSQEGLSLYELFLQVIGIYDNPVSEFELRKLMKKCKVSEDDKGIIVSEEKAYNSIKFYAAKDLPKFELNEPEGVSNVSYDVDCSKSKELSIDELISLFI